MSARPSVPETAKTLKIYQDARLIKQIKNLQRCGGTAALAAEHAGAIFEQLIQRGVGNPKKMGRLTKYGDARIKNCIKFDLVGAYRLVGIMGDDHLKFYFVGSHDECDHWVKNNAGLEPVFKERDRVEAAVKAPPAPRESREAVGAEPEPDYDAQLERNLTDQDLRKIFSGLCGKNPTA